MGNMGILKVEKPYMACFLLAIGLSTFDKLYPFPFEGCILFSFLLHRWIILFAKEV